MLVSVLFSLSTHAQSESVVRIHAYKNSNAFQVGTGSIIAYKNDLYILTCYHVIAQSLKVKVFSQYGELDGIKLAGYDNLKDIAVLKFNKKFNIKKGIEIAEYSSNLTNINATALGHPYNWELQAFKVNITSNNPIKNSSLFGANQEPIFRFVANFDVITLAFEIYGGMSGAPVIVNNKLIGIVSGALNSGGAIAWAIPARYINSLPLTTQVSDFSSLPDYTALRSGNQHLSKSYPITESPSIVQYSIIRKLYDEIDQSYDEYLDLIRQNDHLLKQGKITLDSVFAINDTTTSIQTVDRLLSEIFQLFSDIAEVGEHDIVAEEDINSALEAYQDMLYDLNDDRFEKVLDQALDHEDKIDSLKDELLDIIKSINSILPRELEKQTQNLVLNWDTIPSFENFTKLRSSLKSVFARMQQYNVYLDKYSLLIGELIGTIRAMTDLVYEAKFYQ